MEFPSQDRLKINPLLKKSSNHQRIESINESIVVRPYLGSTAKEITQIQSKIVQKYQATQEKLNLAIRSMALPRRGKENQSKGNLDYESSSSFNNAGFSNMKCDQHRQSVVSSDDSGLQGIQMEYTDTMGGLFTRKSSTAKASRSKPNMFPMNKFLEEKDLTSERRSDSLQPTLLAKRACFFMPPTNVTKDVERAELTCSSYSMSDSTYPDTSQTNHLDVESAFEANKHDGDTPTENESEEIHVAKRTKKSKQPEGMVSDNFVRLNLKNKRGSCRGRLNKKIKNDVYRRRQESLLSSSIQSLNSRSNNLNDGIQVTTSGNDNQIGLRGLGLDPLDLSIESLEKQSVSKNNSDPDFPNQNMQYPSTMIQKSKRNGNPLKDKNLLQDIAPLCPGHQLDCKLCVVKKKGQNKGRKFYSCSYPRDQQCKFIMWIEDNPELAKCIPITDRSTSSMLDHLDRRIDGLLKRYYQRLQDMSSKQLVAEATKYNRRIQFYNDYLRHKVPNYKVISKIILSSKKDDLTKSLMNIADHLMSVDLSSPSTSNQSIQSVTSRIWSDDSSSDSSSVEDLDLDLRKEVPQASSGNSLNVSEDIIEFSDSDEDDEISSSTESTPPVIATSTLTELSVIDALNLYFGFESFRAGQEWAIKRCLDGRRSLFVSATGHGKSLCFTLPSLLLPRITVVVSPLLSLMDDQSKKLPPELPAIVLRGNLPTYEARQIVDQVLNREVKIIFVSPERLCSSSFRSLLGLLQKSYDDLDGSSDSVVSLLCIDEAHCMSQWSYNFRPAFLNIRKAIDLIKPYAVLALTATATPNVQSEIANYLGIDTCNGTLAASCSRSNLVLKAKYAKDEDTKYNIIITLLKSMQKRAVKQKRNDFNAIIYAWRRSDAEAISNFIGAQGLSAGCYHAGLSTLQRSKMQQQFENGQLKVIVATVAFGMGIDKADVSAVIHSYLPSSVEDYVQQTGRAGRNGELSLCYLVIDENACVNQHALSYTHMPSHLQMMVFLANIYRPVSSRTSNVLEPRPFRLHKQICLSLGNVAKVLDCPEATVQTYLAVLEQGNSKKDIVIYVSSELHLDRIQGNFRDLKSLGDSDGSIRNQVVRALLQKSQGNEFDTSMYELSVLLNLTIKEMIKQLYSLQQEGYLQYNLSDPSYVVSLSSPACSDISFESKELFWEWFLTNSQQLCSVLETLNRMNAKRVLDMRSMAKVLESVSCQEIDHESLEEYSDSNQDQLRDLLTSYMQDRIRLDDSSISSNSLISEFLKVPSPFAISPEMQAEKDAMVLVRDPNILSVTAELSTLISSNYGITDGMQNIRRNHISLTAFKIMYGALSSATANGGHPSWIGSPYWGKYKHINPDHLHRLCAGEDI